MAESLIETASHAQKTACSSDGEYDNKSINSGAESHFAVSERPYTAIVDSAESQLDLVLEDLK